MSKQLSQKFRKTWTLENISKTFILRFIHKTTQFRFTVIIFKYESFLKIHDTVISLTSKSMLSHSYGSHNIRLVLSSDTSRAFFKNV